MRAIASLILTCVCITAVVSTAHAQGVGFGRSAAHAANSSAADPSGRFGSQRMGFRNVPSRSVYRVHCGVYRGYYGGLGWCGCGWHRNSWRYGPYWHSSYGGVPLYEIARREDPALLGLEQPSGKPAKPVDEGLVALRNHDFETAAGIYATRAESQRKAEAAVPEEGDAPVEVSRKDFRLAGLAYAGNRQFEQSMRAFREAYAEDPGLRSMPLDGEALIGSSMELRSMVTGAVAHAHRTEEADAWLMVGVLMQAEGRTDRARKMLARAEQMGSTVVVSN
jgi:tetratricopeptide (TPR) repeat protein